MRQHDLYDQIYARDATENGAHGWIQWKGTDVCVDLRCPCGFLGHVDGDFFYAYTCRRCGKKYAVGQVVKLIELAPNEEAYFEYFTPSDHDDLA